MLSYHSTRTTERSRKKCRIPTTDKRNVAVDSSFFWGPVCIFSVCANRTLVKTHRPGISETIEPPSGTAGYWQERPVMHAVEQRTKPPHDCPRVERGAHEPPVVSQIWQYSEASQPVSVVQLVAAEKRVGFERARVMRVARESLGGM